jgi:hypothetical protein
MLKAKKPKIHSENVLFKSEIILFKNKSLKNIHNVKKN